MPAVINPLITDAGMAAAIAASGVGLQLAITHIALGSGQYTPVNAQTAMTGRQEKVAIAGGIVSGTGSFRLSVIFPSWAAAAYNASEIGFYAGDPDAGGILFAVYSTPSGYIVNRTNIDYVAAFAMQLTRVPAGSVTVTVDVSLSQAMAQMTSHLGEVNPHTQYVRHDAAQGLSNAAKNQGRRNLNVEPGGNHMLATTTRTLTIDNAGTVSVDASGGNINITLPAAGAMVGASFRFVRLDTNYGATVTINRAGVDSLSWGAASMASFTLQPGGDSREVVSNGTNAWLSVSAREEGVGTGDVVFVYGNTPRNGTVRANGALLSRELYPRLFQKASAIGFVTETAWASGSWGSYSVGDGVTNFRIPDLRGEFIRCWDDGRGIDSGRSIGLAQSGETASHAHTGTSDAQGSHSHTGAANAGGDHAHTTSMGAAGSHGHAATAAADGWHGHSGNTYAAGYHSHAVYDPGHSHTYSANPVNVWGGAEGGSRESNGAQAATTSHVGTGIGIYGDGNHNHSFDTNGAGSHAHAISVAAGGDHAHALSVANSGTHVHGLTINAAGTHSHNVTVAATGGAETRPRNIALLACIKY